MDRATREVILIRLIEALRGRGSWCGETHVQKATFFLQEMAGAQTGFDFILYKHGPFSFDLRDELAIMRADRLVALRIQHPDYGPSIVPQPSAEALKDRFPKTLRKHEPLIGFVAERFETKPVVELEQLGTAFYVCKELGPTASANECVARIRKLKSHIPVDRADEAVQTVKRWQREATTLLAQS